VETLKQRVDALGRGLALLAACAVVVGAISAAINVSDAIDGQVPAIGRLLLGLWGLGAGLLLWTGRRAGLDGWTAVLIWSIAQLPVIAWNTEGNITKQLIEYPLSASSETTVNGVVTESSEYGINLVGVALVAWASALRERWSRVARPVREDAVAQPSTYSIEFRPEGEGGVPHVLGTTTDAAIAERAALSQAERLRLGGEHGEVVVVARPGGAEMARHST
jgi:hypothetical protein